MSQEESREVPSAAVPVAPTLVSPGVQIREARQRAGLSVDDLAMLTKLSRVTVEAIERDDYQALLEPVYVRGYYRKCAKVLAIDEQPLIDSYAQRVAPKSPLPPAKLRLASGTDLGSTSRLPVPAAAGVAVIAVVVCGMLWFLRGAATSVPSAASLTTLSSPVVAEPVTNAPSTAPETPAPSAEPAPAPTADAAATADGVPSAAAPSSAPVAAAAPVVAPVPVPVPAPSAAASAAAPAAAVPATPAPASGDAATATEGSVSLKFNGRSWVRIKDADGKLIVRTEIAAGESRSYSGKLPLDVFVGDAAAVVLQYGGKTIDLSAYTRSDKTAWLQLPLKAAH